MLQLRDFAVSNSKAILAFAKRYAPALDKKTVYNDLYSEKITAFENMKTYLAIKQTYAATYGTTPYARLPEVEITSPKIRSRFTTAEFTKAVDNKYQQCFNKIELQQHAHLGLIKSIEGWLWEN